MYVVSSSSQNYVLIYSTRYASIDSGHEDDMDDDTNQEEFPDVCLFSVAMMMMDKVIQKYITILVIE